MRTIHTEYTVYDKCLYEDTAEPYTQCIVYAVYSIRRYEDTAERERIHTPPSLGEKPPPPPASAALPVRNAIGSYF